VVKPEVLVLLGAAQALLGSQVRIGRDRGRPMESDLAKLVTITTHPSAILRAEDEDREEAMSAFVSDLKNVASWLSAR
jgi:uracil-DNA glycosylase